MESNLEKSIINFKNWIKEYEWDWDKKDRFYSNRGPLEKEVFNTESYEDAEIFTRELVQNALDAKVEYNNKPVVLNLEIIDFSISPDRRSIYNQLINIDILKLLEDSKNIRKGFSPTYKALKISDFNTTGLNGSVIDDNSNWYKYFIKIGNLTDLSKQGKLGCANLGKIAVWKSSNLWMVFARSCIGDKKFRFQGRCLRDDDTPDKKNYKIINSCDVFFRKKDKEDVEIDNDRNSDLSNLLYLDHRKNTGTDFIFPEFKTESLSKDEIIKFAIKNWFKAIAENRIKIDIFGEQINSESYKGLIQKYGTNHPDLDEDVIDFAIDASNENCDRQYTLKKSNSFDKYRRRSLSKDFFEDFNIDEKLLIKSIQKEGKHIQIKVPVIIKNAKGVTFENNYFLISLKMRTTKNKLSTFGLMFRQDQILWEEDDFYRSSNINDLMICIISNRPLLNKLLTHFEEPSHLKFNRRKFKGGEEFDRNSAEQVLYLFRNVANKFIEFLISEDEEINPNALSDVFPSIDIKSEEEDEDDDDDELEEPDENDDDDDGDSSPDNDQKKIPPSKTEKLLKEPFQDGGLVKLTSIKSEEIIGMKIKIILGVLSVGKNPFKGLDPFKIDLREATFSNYEGCDIDISSITFNSFELIIRDESFSITIEDLEPARAYANKYVDMGANS